jgi:hypothetical protein
MNLCKCHNIPRRGSFILENKYKWYYIIDGIYVIDENNSKILFNEIEFLWYFSKEV